jgi:hypothetical protein
MTDDQRYADAALAHAVREWMKESAPTTAPERLVYSIVDEVERSPRRRSSLAIGGVRLQTVWQYVALTVVIAIGVAAGTFFTRQGPSGTHLPSPSPSASPSASPSTSPRAELTPVAALPSLQTIGRYAIAVDPGPSAIGVAGSSLWVGLPDKSIVELDPSTGEELGRAAVGVEPITIELIDALLWLGSDGEDLIWVDPTSREVGAIRGAGGHYILSWGGSLWVSREEEFLQVDPSARKVIGRIAVAGHRASEPGLIVGDELWTGSGPRIVRVALDSGSVQGTIPTTALGLVATSTGVLAVDAAGALLRISASTGPLDAPVPVLNGLAESYGQAVDGDRLWAVTGGDVVEIDLTAGRFVSRTHVGRGTRAVAVTGRSVWVAVDTGELVRLVTAE